MDVKMLLKNVKSEGSKELIKEFCQISEDFKSGKKSAADCQVPLATAKHALQTLAYEMTLQMSTTKMKDYERKQILES